MYLTILSKLFTPNTTVHKHIQKHVYYGMYYCCTQALGILNHMGVSVSYSGAWKYSKLLSTESMYLETVRSGKWLWAYHNLNIHKSIRHEREGKHVNQCGDIIDLKTKGL